MSVLVNIHPMTTTEKTLSGLVTRAIKEYGMIETGDRVLVAASGGKDSTSLLFDLASKRRYRDFDFTLEAVHISSDFCRCCKKSRLEALFRDLDVPFHDVDVAIIGRLKPGRSMNCYWCSTQRRTELIRFAMEHGFNKIALGHHLDDIIETLFMNMLQKSELSTMPPVMKYDKYPVTIIRPLALVEEKQIIRYAVEKGIDRIMCTCPYGVNSKRKDIRKRIDALTGGSGLEKRNLFYSLRNVKEGYLT